MNITSMYSGYSVKLNQYTARLMLKITAEESMVFPLS